MCWIMLSESELWILQKGSGKSPCNLCGDPPQSRGSCSHSVQELQAVGRTDSHQKEEHRRTLLHERYPSQFRDCTDCRLVLNQI